jgi:immunity protein 26 of polymorphic toxin system
MAKVGDRFAFRLTSREWLSGRVLLDVGAQCIKPKRVQADSELGFFSAAFLVEIYATPTAQPKICAEEVLVPSMFIYPGGFKGEWQVLDNVAVDPTQVDFPPALLMRGTGPHLSWGELSLATTLTAEEADAMHVRGTVHGAGLVPAICLVELGRGAELDPVDYPNPSLLGLASSDLRRSPHAARALAAAGLVNWGAYYERALARGFDLARFYAPKALLLCPYCFGSYRGDRFCPHCAGDTTRDAIVELTPEAIEREPREPCVACNRPVFVAAQLCPHCRAPQPRRSG